MKREYLFVLFTAFTLNCGKTFGQPSIAFRPKDQTVLLHQQAAFGVIASPYTSGFSYQWRKDGVPIAGATNDQVVLAHPQLSDAGQYSVVVYNAEGSVTSADAALTVNPPKAGDLDYSFVCITSAVPAQVSSVVVQSDGKVLIGGWM